MNIEIMRKHYERTPKETLINVLVASREQVDKLQKRNKELKQEIERLKELCDKYEEEHKTTFEEWKKTINIIKEVREYIENHSITNMEWWITGQQKVECKFMEDANPQELLELLDKGSDKE